MNMLKKFKSRKAKSPLRELRQMAQRATSHTSQLAPESTATSATPTMPHTPSVESADGVSLAPCLQELLWNRAYDEIRETEPKLVDAYETILSAHLHQVDPGSAATEPAENCIGQTRDVRYLQLQQIVRSGLARTKNETSAKQGIGQSLQVVQQLRGVMDRATQSVPQAAVAWVAFSVGLEMIMNPVKQAAINRQGIIYVLSRMDWYWNLTPLLLHEDDAGGLSQGTRDEMENRVGQLYQKLLLYQIKNACHYHRSRLIALGRDLFLLEDWAMLLADIKVDEAILQRDAELYSSELVKRDLDRLVRTAAAQETSLQSIHSAIHDLAQQQVRRHQDDKNEHCLKALHVTDPRKDKERIQDTKGGLLRDSYRWILDHPDFQNFRGDPQCNLLWIKGDPGKGKTMLMCGIIEELERESNDILSYFFCQATETRLNNAESVLRGLLFLLLQQQPSLVSYVRAKYDIAGDKLFHGNNVWMSLKEMLLDILQDPTLDDVVLLVDALDECNNNLPRLLDFITEISTISRAKWIVSSRNWLDIEEKLNTAKTKIRLCLELNEVSVSHAVQAFIRTKVAKLREQKNYDNEMENEVRRYLTENAHGTFLWVALVCEELADPRTRKRHTISKLMSYPAGLSPLYDRMMQVICDSDDAATCKEILSIMSIVYRPLALAEMQALSEALQTWERAEVEEIIALSGSFLTLKDDVIYFVHQSAKDFLVNEASHHILPFGSSHQHHCLFSKSLKMMSETLRRDIYDLGAEGFPIDQVSPPVVDPLEPIRYSIVHWVDHLSDSKYGMEDAHVAQRFDAVDTFIRKHFVHWLESLSLLQAIPRGVMAVQKLHALARHTTSERLSELLQDARRFTLSHKRSIESTPLQVYYSALVFSPSHSIIKQLFSDKSSNWMALAPCTEQNWDACLQTLEGHTRSVQSVIYSPDGRQLASCSDDKAIKMWDAQDGTCIHTLEGHGDYVRSVMYSPDGRQLASCSDDKAIKMWDARDGTCTLTLEGHGDWVRSVMYSPDGRQLASCSSDKTIKMWDAQDGTCIHTLKGHNDYVRSVIYSPDGRQLASCSSDRTIKMWDAQKGTCIHTLKGHSDHAKAVTYSPNGQRLVSCSDDKTIKMWDAVTTGFRQTLDAHSGTVQFLTLSPNSERLVSCSNDGTIKLWDMATGVCEHTLQGHNDMVQSVIFSQDGQYLFSFSHDKTVKFWDITRGTCIQTVKDCDGVVRAVVLSPDGQHIIICSDSMTFKMRDIKNGTCIHTLEGHGDWVRSVIYSPDGRQLASCSSDKTIKMWDAQDGTCIHTLEGHEGLVLSVIYSPDGRQLASCSDDNTIKMWDAQNGTCTLTLEGHGGRVRSVMYSPDGHQLASCSDDNTIKMWDAQGGTCTLTLEGHNDYVRFVIYSPDGRQLASCSDDNTIKMWDAHDGTCIHTLEGHEGLVLSVIYSPDGRQLASCSDDKTIKMWDAQNGTCIHTLEGHGNWVQSMIYSPDGRQLASCSDDKTINMWDAQDGTCIRTFYGFNLGSQFASHSSNGRLLVLWSAGGRIDLLDPSTSECLHKLEGDGGEVNMVTLSPDGQYFVSRSNAKTITLIALRNTKSATSLQIVRHYKSETGLAIFLPDSKRFAACREGKNINIWDTATGAWVETFRNCHGRPLSLLHTRNSRAVAFRTNETILKIWDGHSDECLQALNSHELEIQVVASSSNGQRLASYSANKTIKIWDTQDVTCINTFTRHKGDVRAMIYSPDGKRLVLCLSDNTIKMWDAEDGTCIHSLEGHGGRIRSMVYSPDGRQLASCSSDNMIKMWDAEDGTCIHTLEGHTRSVQSVIYSPDGRQLASCSDDRTIRMWDTQGGTCTLTLEGHGGRVRSVIYSPDGRQLATCSDDNTIKMWDAQDGTCTHTLEGHGGRVQSVIYSPDGRQLASCSDDKTIKMWDAQGGTCTHTLEGHGDWVRFVMYSPDGQQLASCSDDNTIKVWKVATGECLRTLESRGGLLQFPTSALAGLRGMFYSEDRIIKIWDASTGICLNTLVGHSEWPNAVISSADGQHLVSCSDDKTIKLWDAATSTCLQTIEVGNAATQLSFHPTNNSCLCTDIGFIMLDRWRTSDPDSTQPAHRQITYLPSDITPDGMWVTKRGENMLWLPTEYRPSAVAVAESTIALGCVSGRVAIMKFT